MMMSDTPDTIGQLRCWLDVLRGKYPRDAELAAWGDTLASAIDAAIEGTAPPHLSPTLREPAAARAVLATHLKSFHHSDAGADCLGYTLCGVEKLGPTCALFAGHLGACAHLWQLCCQVGEAMGYSRLLDAAHVVIFLVDADSGTARGRGERALEDLRAACGYDVAHARVLLLRQQDLDAPRDLDDGPPAAANDGPEIHASGFLGWGPTSLCGAPGLVLRGCGEFTCPACVELSGDGAKLAARVATLEQEIGKPNLIGILSCAAGRWPKAGT